MQRLIVLVLALGLAASPLAAEERTEAQDVGRPSTRGRVIGAVAGAAGGFVLGIVAGLHWFDDAVNSDRKVWTTAIAFGAAGGVGGYFVGRAASRSTIRPALGPDTDLAVTLPRIRLARSSRLGSQPIPSRAATARLSAALSGAGNGR